MLLPRIASTTLHVRRVLGKGSFGEVCLAWWEGGLVEVAVKANGVQCANITAIDNERKLLELLLQHPHRNILVVYGIVTDAPDDGGERLVMAYCPHGSLDVYLELEVTRTTGEVRSTLPSVLLVPPRVRQQCQRVQSCRHSHT